MKKLFCVFLALLATVCLLSMSVSAEASVILSDDLQTMTINDKTYSRADLSAMDLYYDVESYPVQVPQQLQSQLKQASAYTAQNQWIVSVELYYLDGSRQDICFVYDGVRSELLRLCQDDELICSVQVWWEDVPSVSASISRFKGTPTMLESSELTFLDAHHVTYFYRELDANVHRGFVCEYMETFYYVDFQENNIVNPVGFFPHSGPDALMAYEITDTDLIERLDELIESEYSGETEIGQILSALFLCFVFAVIPGVIMIVCVIFSIRSKGYYRLTWAVTAGLCAAELGVFAIIVSLILRA